ncbi:hypothetical protein ABW21_db0208998 [Orbilia brochopaga]|nr:hypothetical protein ABW21_db0208998 [Drechslerella brochopaga]
MPKAGPVIQYRAEKVKTGLCPRIRKWLGSWRKKPVLLLPRVQDHTTLSEEELAEDPACGKPLYIQLAIDKSKAGDHPGASVWVAGVPIVV